MNKLLCVVSEPLLLLLYNEAIYDFIGMMHDPDVGADNTCILRSKALQSIYYLWLHALGTPMDIESVTPDELDQFCIANNFPLALPLPAPDPVRDRDTPNNFVIAKMTNNDTPVAVIGLLPVIINPIPTHIAKAHVIDKSQHSVPVNKNQCSKSENSNIVRKY